MLGLIRFGDDFSLSVSVNWLFQVGGTRSQFLGRMSAASGCGEKSSTKSRSIGSCIALVTPASTYDVLVHAPGGGAVRLLASALQGSGIRHPAPGLPALSERGGRPNNGVPSRACRHGAEAVAGEGLAWPGSQHTHKHEHKHCLPRWLGGCKASGGCTSAGQASPRP